MGGEQVGVIVGRFQVPELHAGHRALIDHVMERHPRVVIIVGISTEGGTAQNPMSYYTRALMLQSAYPGAVVLPLSDHPSDNVWSRNVDALLQEAVPYHSCRLYWSRASTAEAYSGGHPKEFVPPLPDGPTGTAIREDIFRAPSPTRAFRAGIIYACIERERTGERKTRKDEPR